MKTVATLSRREWLTQTALASGAVAVAGAQPVSAEPDPMKTFKIIGFSKPFQHLRYDETADVVAEIGWDGIECPVRPRGQIEPENAEDELPKMVEALQKYGLEVGVMTTRINRVSEPLTEKLLRTASKLGIRRYRMNYWKYDRRRPVMEQLKEYKPWLKNLAAMNKEFGIQGCYQNHSGNDYIGAPIWDLYEMIKELDPRHLGVCFDIGHATVEGGYAWESHVHLMQPHFGAVYLKDFKWEKTAKGWKVAWCPVGQGMVNRSFFTRLIQSGFKGPISQHHEYDHGEGKEMIQRMQRDLKVLKQWLAEA